MSDFKPAVRGKCYVCGKPLSGGVEQYAHRIANTEANRRKWGSEIIDTTYNGEMVCSLRCNDTMNIGFNPGKCWELVHHIATMRLQQYEQEQN